MKYKGYEVSELRASAERYYKEKRNSKNRRLTRERNREAGYVKPSKREKEFWD